MKTPAFWYSAPGFLSTLFQPLGWLYGKGGKFLSYFKKPQYFKIPIISIGNIVSGGSGKTPTAIALAHLLHTRGYKVHFVTRGYRGKEKGPLKVDRMSHAPKDVGDEPLLLAEHAPTWVAKKRAQGVQKAIENGAQLIILDDGHQTTSLHKDVSLVVIDLLQGFGNECVIPAGPLRENLSEGLERADGFIFIGEGEISPSSLRVLQHSSFDFSASRLRSGRTEERIFPNSVHPERRLPELVEGSQSRRIERYDLNSHSSSLRGTPLFKARLIPDSLKLPSKRVIAFCGLGFPQKFYTSLEKEGFELIATKSFPDHYQYTQEDLLRLEKLAQHHHCALITTRKDLIKIPPSWQKLLYVLDITIKFEDPEKICSFILQKIHH